MSPPPKSPIGVSLVILTQRRPAALAVAAASALRQADVAGAELVIVDNDQRPSARAFVERLGQNAPMPVRYVHEPDAGVANARNTAVASTDAPLIAFLDDDEEAPDGWLAALLAAQARFDADVVFGPVRGRAPEDTKHRAYLEWFFSRLGPAEAGIIEEAYGCGDSLIRRTALPDQVRPFLAHSNETGGEDDVLFQRMGAAGARFGWAPDAWVWEDPIPARLTLGYALKRAFVYGQSAPYYCALQNPPDWLGVLRWMVIGAGQAAVYGAMAAAQWLLRRPGYAFTLDRAARGVGKVFWGGPFKLKLYGQPAAAKAATTPEPAQPSPFALPKAPPTA